METRLVHAAKVAAHGARVRELSAFVGNHWRAINYSKRQTARFGRSIGHHLGDFPQAAFRAVQLNQ